MYKLINSAKTLLICQVFGDLRTGIDILFVIIVMANLLTIASSRPTLNANIHLDLIILLELLVLCIFVS